MKILVACEESQVVCKAFRQKGHEAYSCDIKHFSGDRPEWHIKGDVLSILNPIDYIDIYGQPKFGLVFNTCDGYLHELSGGWDMLIAHPPCTYLSKAGACNYYDKSGNLNQERFEKGLAAREFFMILLNCDIPKICVENPVPMAMFGLPHHSQIIQPYWFGHPYSKRTLLWLKGLPPLFATLIEPEYESWTAIHHSAKIRSKTFPGIAAAMAEQWG